MTKPITDERLAAIRAMIALTDVGDAQHHAITDLLAEVERLRAKVERMQGRLHAEISENRNLQDLADVTLEATANAIKRWQAMTEPMSDEQLAAIRAEARALIARGYYDPVELLADLLVRQIQVKQLRAENVAMCEIVEAIANVPDGSDDLIILQSRTLVRKARALMVQRNAPAE